MLCCVVEPKGASLPCLHIYPSASLIRATETGFLRESRYFVAQGTSADHLTSYCAYSLKLLMLSENVGAKRRWFSWYFDFAHINARDEIVFNLVEFDISD